MATTDKPKKRDIISVFVWLGIGLTLVGLVQVVVQAIMLTTDNASNVTIMLLVIGGFQTLLGLAWVIGAVRVRASLRKTALDADAEADARARADAGAGTRNSAGAAAD